MWFPLEEGGCREVHSCCDKQQHDCHEGKESQAVVAHGFSEGLTLVIGGEHPTEVTEHDQKQEKVQMLHATAPVAGVTAASSSAVSATSSSNGDTSSFSKA